MNTCKKCGKNSKNELCYRCGHKQTKQPCSVCGKICSGVMCADCRSATAAKNTKQYCVDCGKELSFSYNKNRMRCVKCANKAIAEKRRSSHNYPEFLVCEHCGEQFPFRLISSTLKPPRFCSFSCVSKHRHQINNNTAEAMKAKVCDYIKNENRFVSASEIKAALKITAQQLRRYNISVRDCNADLGFFEVVRVAEGTSKERNISVDSGCIRAVELREAIVDWLKNRGVATTVREILSTFKIDYYCTWRRYGFDIVDIHRAAGVPYSRTSSWAEREAAAMFLDAFGETDVVTQKRFSDLVSDKGWPFRFDIYVKSKNTLIEIDGEQHYDKSHTYAHTSDDVKERYARDNGIPLIRIRIQPAATFKERVITCIHNLKSDVIKESELLEA